MNLLNLEQKLPNIVNEPFSDYVVIHLYAHQTSMTKKNTKYSQKGQKKFQILSVHQKGGKKPPGRPL